MNYLSIRALRELVLLFAVVAVATGLLLAPPAFANHSVLVEVEVLSGIEAGVPIVLYPSEQLADGHRVRQRSN